MKFLRFRWLFVAAALLFISVAVAAMSSQKARQGLAIVQSKATGSLPDVGWIDLFRMIRSGQHFGLPELASTASPYAAIHNPYSYIVTGARGCYERYDCTEQQLIDAGIVRFD